MLGIAAISELPISTLPVAGGAGTAYPLFGRKSMEMDTNPWLPAVPVVDRRRSVPGTFPQGIAYPTSLNSRRRDAQNELPPAAVAVPIEVPRHFPAYPVIPALNLPVLLIPWDHEASTKSRRHEQLVSGILNSLLRQGILVQTGPQEWNVVPK